MNLSDLDDAVVQIEALRTFLEESLIEIDERVNVMRAEWSGAAAAAYDTAHTEWIASARTATDGIAKMRAAARSAHDSYTATIVANRALLGRDGGSSTPDESRS
ncbi:WXG100 family type VII secretion target [Nocardia mangyaensis]|uniref:WXG100 family type VII secretion target n=1 Tax=Nocardia mangyaensis TaxID=2213200 RepID=UPI0026756338|nr:WXG100 family type VII secretion target [Nocardia mangyaensis]MDO3645880.1 WXG100 family type VII secretion target [Nocardia mangyaensis]